MAVSADELYNWIVANWGDKVAKESGFGTPSSEPNTLAFYLDKNNNGVYFWNGAAWVGMSDSNNAANTKNISLIPGDSLGEKLQNAINDSAPGALISLSDYVNTIDQVIVSPIVIDKPMRIEIPSMIINANLAEGEDLFNVLSDSVQIIGSGRSPRSDDGTDVTVTRIVMNSGRYHVSGSNIGSLILNGFDLYGIRTEEKASQDSVDPGNVLDSSYTTADAGKYFTANSVGTYNTSNGDFVAEITTETVGWWLYWTGTAYKVKRPYRDRGDVRYTDDSSKITSSPSLGDFYCLKDLENYPDTPNFRDAGSPNYVDPANDYTTSYPAFLPDVITADKYDKAASAIWYNGSNWVKIDKNDLGLLEGCGGVYLNKKDHGEVYAGNNINQINIDNVFFRGTYGHGIFLNTPILCKVRNVRVSKATGHGVFVSGGTSTSLQTVYCSSTGMAGICLNGLAYSFLDTCVSEYSGASLWLRSCFGVSILSSGGEEQRPKTVNYGLRLYAYNTYGVPVEIDDMSADYKNNFDGHGYMITGGEAITINSPLSTNIGGGSSPEINARHFYIAGNVRNCLITNPKLSMSGETEAEAIYQYDWEFDNKGGAPKVIVYYNLLESDIAPRITNTSPKDPSDYFSFTKTVGEVNYVLLDADTEVQFITPNEVYLPSGYNNEINSKPIALLNGGIDADRPASPNNYETYFDTTLGYLITYNGTNWVDSTGNIV